MNIAVFTPREIQTFIAISQTFESEGVTDVRFIRQRLDEELRQTMLKSRRKSRPQNWQQKKRIAASKSLKISLPACPSCGKAHLQPAANNEGLKILACRACRYSEVVA